MAEPAPNPAPQPEELHTEAPEAPATEAAQVNGTAPQAPDVVMTDSTPQEPTVILPFCTSHPKS